MNRRSDRGDDPTSIERKGEDNGKGAAFPSDKYRLSLFRMVQTIAKAKYQNSEGVVQSAHSVPQLELVSTTFPRLDEPNCFTRR